MLVTYQNLEILEGSGTMKCSKCGNSYDLEPIYKVDTWNIGHYGCNRGNAPSAITGYRDTGCPYCRVMERQRAEAMKPKLVKTYVEGNTKYTLYAEPVSYDSFATQNNGTINFDLVNDEPPKVTVRQWKLIRAMVEQLGIEFTGTTLTEAQEFISENIDEFNRLHDEENLTVSKDIYGL